MFDSTNHWHSNNVNSWKQCNSFVSFRSVCLVTISSNCLSVARALLNQQHLELEDWLAAWRTSQCCTRLGTRSSLATRTCWCWALPGRGPHTAPLPILPSRCGSCLPCPAPHWPAASCLRQPTARPRRSAASPWLLHGQEATGQGLLGTAVWTAKHPGTVLQNSRTPNEFYVEPGPLAKFLTSLQGCCNVVKSVLKNI